MKSEYLGIRVAMHDALQRYYAMTSSLSPVEGGSADGNMIKSQLQALIEQSCMENNLLTDGRKAIVGKVWAAFVGSRSPEAVLAFVNDPEVRHYCESTQPIRDVGPNMGVINAYKILIKELNFKFEDVAQRTGLINYASGETLSGYLRATESSLRQSAAVTGPQAEPENWLLSFVIKHLFDSKHGKLKDSDLGRSSGFNVNAGFVR